MDHSEYLRGISWVKGEPKGWFPTVKLILAFIIGLMALTPAILGLYWELLLPR